MACWPKKRSDLWGCVQKGVEISSCNQIESDRVPLHDPKVFFQRATLKQVEKCCLDVCILIIVPFL